MEKPASSCSSFRSSKLTSLQIQGAQEERSRQSIEKIQVTDQWSLAQSRWQSHVLGVPNEHRSSLFERGELLSHRKQEFLMIFQVIQSTFPFRQMSIEIFHLCRVGYWADVVSPKALKHLEIDCRLEMASWKERLNREKEERLQSIQRLQEKILRVQREMRRMTLNFTTRKLESKIQWLRQQKLDLEQYQASMVHRDHHQDALGRDPDLVEFVDVVASCFSSSRTSEQKKDSGSSSPVKVAVVVVEEPVDCNHLPISSSSSSTPSSLSKFGESVEWIDIDDEYFRGATASVEETSDWVLCAL